MKKQEYKNIALEIFLKIKKKRKNMNKITMQVEKKKLQEYEGTIKY